MVDNHGDRKFPKDRVSLVINGGSNPLNQPRILSGMILQLDSGQISIIPKPELFRGFWGSSLIKPLVGGFNPFEKY